MEIYGAVCSAETTSIEQGRKPVARGHTETEEGDVFRAHPQLTKLLCTNFKSLVVGYRDEGRVVHQLPPKPAHIHGFITQCSLEEVREFSRTPAFLRLMIADRSLPWMDETISACLRHCSLAHDDPVNFLVSAGRKLASLLGGDFHRLDIILSGIKG